MSVVLSQLQLSFPLAEHQIEVRLEFHDLIFVSGAHIVLLLVHVPAVLMSHPFLVLLSLFVELGL